MFDIREAIKQEHENAENQPFVNVLMSGEITPELYGTYIYNLYQSYKLLEQYAKNNNLFETLPHIERADKLYFDYTRLWKQETPPKITDSVLRYIYHLDSIKEQPEKLMAHVYVRHMGDLYGGQMIRKKTPGPNSYLIFLKAEELKVKIRSLLSDYLRTYQVNIVADAKLCFEYATELFGEMYDLGNANTVQK